MRAIHLTTASATDETRRATRRMNIAGMSGADLFAERARVAAALLEGASDDAHLLEDIDAELDLRRREP
jgi:hypothetical protein